VRLELNEEPRMPPEAGLVLLGLRGLLLWLLIPFTILWWLVILPHWLKIKVGLGQLIGWSDLNLCAAIEKSVLRPFVKTRLNWVPLSEAPGVIHRVGLLDAA
jgi:hypothetical protein